MSEVCEQCGLYMDDPQCKCDHDEALVIAMIERLEEPLLQRYAVHGRYGAVGQESEESLVAAEEALCSHLGFKLSYDRQKAIEGTHWWFIPEGWIGMIGFIVEKQSNCIFELGSALISIRQNQTLFGKWACIDEYLSGRVPPVTA